MKAATHTNTEPTTKQDMSYNRLLSAEPGFQRDRRRSAPGITVGIAQTKEMDKRKNYYAVVVFGQEQREGKIFESWPETELMIKVGFALVLFVAFWIGLFDAILP